MNAGRPNTNLENQLPFTPGESLSIFERNYFSFGKQTPEIEASLNNYLKTPEEMEAEFCFVINTRKALYPEPDFNGNHSGIKITTDGYLNIPTPEETFSGFMEENY